MAEDNKQYKDRLFNFLFGSEVNKSWTLSLYNAVNGSAYDDPEAIEITTIKEVMYLGMHNDVSFLISNEMALFEQQSTYNPNLPLRMLQYIGNLYEKYIIQRKLNKYGSKVIELPVPKLVAFYNGAVEKEDEIFLHLSDSFPENSASDIEVKVRMLNINYGRNRTIQEKCKPLAEYAWLVERVRNNNGDVESVIDRTISEMPDNFVIKPFLIAHRSEVKGMLLTEYNEAETMELFKEEGRIEGRKEGRKEGRREGRKEGRREGILEILFSMVKDKILTTSEAAQRAGMTVDEFEKAIKNVGI